MSDPIQQSIDENKTVYRRLGSSGLRVSVPILGAMSFGDPAWIDWILPEEESLPVLKAAYDKGLNTWDTANVYSNGRSEEIIGKALKKYNIPREKVVILSKCYGYVGEDPGTRTIAYGAKIANHKDYVNKGGLSRGAIFKAVDASLKRMDTDYMDLLQIHRYDPTTPIEETMKALHDLVESGKVRYIGASSMWTWQFAMMQAVAEKHNWTKFVSMQNHYSLLYREEEREMNAYCNATGVGLIPWSPLCRGYLARPSSAQRGTARSDGEAKNTMPMFNDLGTSDVDKSIIDRVQEIADKKGVKMSQVALAWINKKVTSPIVGFSKVDRIDEALEANKVELTDEEVKKLEELYKPRAISGHQ
ncbi:NADP-dependent oxidoreductase domain-containing protein [Elsinoe ampelina]|uniref:NADP-dependent oxidoreductase domain-containing protein n=1 Tax=Elsinoe ampelina TaxID=302913 RepID=A0A6A6G6J9_9PEZI|nr:NADP-dependent oxidoreductase domain-containing protein [Elsinoe ampelina]